MSLALIVVAWSLGEPTAAGPRQASPLTVPAQAAVDDGARRAQAWRQAVDLDRAGRDAEAEALLRNLLALEQQDRPTAVGTLRVQVRLISVLMDLDRAEEALVQAQSGYPVALARLGAADPLTQDFRAAVSSLLALTGRYDAAEPYLREDFEAEMAAGGPDAARSTGSILARVYDGLGRYADARAVRLRITEGAADDPEALEARIDLLLEAGDKVGAEPLARRLIVARQGGAPKDLRQARLRLARSLFHSTDDVADDPRIVEAEALYRSLYAEDHAPGMQASAAVVGELGDLLILTAEADTPRQDEGLALNEEVLDLMAHNLGPNHPEVLSKLGKVALYQVGMLHFDRAAANVERFRRAVADGAVASLVTTVTVMSVETQLAYQADDDLAAWRILSRGSRTFHDGVALTSRGEADGGRQFKDQMSFIDRTRIAIAWRLAESMSQRATGN